MKDGSEPRKISPKSLRPEDVPAKYREKAYERIRVRRNQVHENIRSLKEDPPDRSTEELNKLKLELNRKLRTLDRRENRLRILLGDPEKPVDEET